jgi:hypothetical protein
VVVPGPAPDPRDVVLGAAGDIPRQQTVAAAWYVRWLVPDLRMSGAERSTPVP